MKFNVTVTMKECLDVPTMYVRLLFGVFGYRDAYTCGYTVEPTLGTDISSDFRNENYTIVVFRTAKSALFIEVSSFLRLRLKYMYMYLNLNIDTCE